VQTLINSHRLQLVSDPRLELRIQQPSGTLIDIEVTTTPTRWNDESGWILTVRDVTERKQLEATERQQRAFAESLHEATASLNTLSDLDAVLSAIFDMVARVVPYDAASIMLIEGDEAYIVSERGFDVRGSDVKGWRLPISMNTKLQVMIRAGKPLILADTHLEANWTQLAGTEWIRGNISTPIRVGGAVIGFLNLDSAKVGAFSDDDGLRLRAFADQIGIALRNAKMRDDDARYTAQLEAMVEARTAEQSRQHAQTENSLRTALDAEHIALTREKNLNELIARFVSAISHEFKNPLASIMLAADFLKLYREQVTPERIGEKVDTILSEIYKLDALIEEILFAHRSEHVGVEFKPQTINLIEMADQVVADARRLASYKHRIALSLPTDCLEVTLDDRLIRRTLINLLVNAIKYSPHGGTVELDIACSDSALMLSVRDHGIGIPEEELANIFDTFYRCKNTIGYPGTGLGLTIVKQAIDLHNGTIAVESQIDVGTTFIIQIPHWHKRSLNPLTSAAIPPVATAG